LKIDVRNFVEIRQKYVGVFKWVGLRTMGFLLAVRNETIQLGSLVCGGAFFIVAVFRLEKMAFSSFFYRAVDCVF
jgi:hypothetical protein